jgi:hypothetical protein
VTTDPAGARIYLNGRLVLEKKHLTLRFPGGDGRVRLVLGNSVYGNTSWEGDLHGFAIYPFPLSPDGVAAHYNAWRSLGDFSFAAAEGAVLAYRFDEAAGGRVLDSTGSGLHLEIPPRMTLLKRQVLTFPANEFSLRAGFLQDVVVNFTGFVPFGFLVAALLFRLQGRRRRAVAVAVAAGFAVSLGIEIGQSWMPSRSSSLLDLAMNTAGTGAGAAVFGLVCRRILR